MRQQLNNKLRAIWVEYEQLRAESNRVFKEIQKHEKRFGYSDTCITCQTSRDQLITAQDRMDLLAVEARDLVHILEDCTTDAELCVRYISRS